MILFDLECRTGGHIFECWFASSAEYDRQQESGLVACPQCGTTDVTKAVMAPRLARKGNQRGDALPAPTPAEAPPAAPLQMTQLPAEAQAMLRKVAAMQAEALKTSTWVGEKFAEDARAMHYGDKPEAPIHGKATPQQARSLAEEGIKVAPVLIPFVPPDEVN